MVTDVYRVYAYDLNTNALIAELPAAGLSFDSRINDSGSISFSLAISRPEVAGRVKSLMAYNGNPFKVYVDRDGIIVWGGIIWTWQYTRAAGVLSLSGKEIRSYFDHRFLAADYSLTVSKVTTTSSAISSPTSTLTVTSTTGFVAGMICELSDTAPETVTISSVTAPSTITLTANTVLAHPAGSILAYSVYPSSQLTVFANTGSTSLTVASNAGFVAGMKIVQGTFGAAENLTVASVSGSYIINLTTPTVTTHPVQSPMSYAIDPAALAYKAVTDAQNTVLAGVGSNIGVVVSGGTSTIPPIIPGYTITQSTPVANLLKDMSALHSPVNGTVDVRFLSAWNNRVPVDTMVISSPRSGLIGAASTLIFDLARSLDYSWPTDALSMGTSIRATGANSLVSVTSSPAVVGGAGNLPRLDKIVSFSSIQTQSQLDAMTASLGQQFGVPVSTPTLVQTTSSSPVLGTFAVGDDALLYIASDERFPTGIYAYWRIIGYQVIVPNEGVSTITFTFNKPPVY